MEAVNEATTTLYRVFRRMLCAITKMLRWLRRYGGPEDKGVIVSYALGSSENKVWTDLGVRVGTVNNPRIISAEILQFPPQITKRTLN